ncbi:TlpA family protein disulfide reductase, partial [Enterococcus faecium]
AKALLQQGHGLAVLAVATDPPGEQAKVAAFLAQLHGQLPPLVAIADANLQPYLTWGVPVTYLIDRDGKVKARLLGPRPWSQTAPLLGPAIESF